MTGSVENGVVDDRLATYASRVDGARQVLALVWLPLFVVSRMVDSPTGLATALDVGSDLVWLGFLLDYVLRVLLARRRAAYVRTHLFDVVALVIPPLRLLWGLHSVRSVLKQPGFGFFLVATLVVMLTAAGLVFAAERHAVHGNIHSFGDAMWWALATTTTVGYGDRTPVSGLGRALGGSLMLAGVLLYSVVTAHIVAFVLARSRAGADRAVLERLDAMAFRLEALEGRIPWPGETGPAGDRG